MTLWMFDPAGKSGDTEESFCGQSWENSCAAVRGGLRGKLAHAGGAAFENLAAMQGSDLNYTDVKERTPQGLLLNHHWSHSLLDMATSGLTMVQSRHADTDEVCVLQYSGSQNLLHKPCPPFFVCPFHPLQSNSPSHPFCKGCWRCHCECYPVLVGARRTLGSWRCKQVSGWLEPDGDGLCGCSAVASPHNRPSSWGRFEDLLAEEDTGVHLLHPAH